MDKTIKTLTEVLKDTKKEGTSPYDTTATVVRIEGQTAWVHIPGGIDETPVSMTIDCKEGDTVQVRVSGGRAWITGNQSAPPTDDTVAKVADVKATNAEKIAIDAQEVATETNQYFWFTPTGSDTGAHISEVPQEQFTNPNSPNYHSGGNLLARSNGLALRDGMIELATLEQSGMNINTDDGNGNLVNIAHLGYGPGTDSGGGTSDAPYYNLGIRIGTVGNYSVAEGANCEASGYCSHAEGCDTVASGFYAHAEGYKPVATGNYAHAEGWETIAEGLDAHAEGSNSYAQGDGSHAEGFSTHASGGLSHAEGRGSVASGNYSHSQNQYTVADQQSQTAIGNYNTKNNTNNLFAIGNGTADNARSDCFTVDDSGNVVAAGTIKATFNSTAYSVGTRDSLVRSVHTTSKATLNGNSQSGALTETFTKAGYYPLAIAGFQSLGSYGTHVVPSNLRITSASSGSVTISYTLKNTSSSNSTNTGLDVHILWIKE